MATGKAKKIEEKKNVYLAQTVFKKKNREFF